MSDLHKWIERKAGAAAYQLSLGNAEAAHTAMMEMGKYSVESEATKNAREAFLLDPAAAAGGDKQAILAALQPLVDAVKKDDPTPDAKAMLLGL